MSDNAKEFAVHLNWWYRASFTGGPVPTLEDVITARDTRIAAERDKALRELAVKWEKNGWKPFADELLALLDSWAKTNSV